MDKRTLNHLMQLLAIHRANLAHYEQQAEMHGGVDYAPPIVRNSIAHERDQIARIEQQVSGRCPN
jgi:hypothetical protein